MLVTCRYGHFEIPNEKDLIAKSLCLYGEWAQSEIEVLANFIQEGNVVADIGAFIGTHARAFSEIVGKNGKIYAFEPNSSAYLFLEENAKKSSLQNIITLQFALGARDQEMRVVSNLSNDNQGATRLDIFDGKSDQKVVEVRSLDSFNIEKINFIKIDVEGMELAVLTGADEVINKYKPTIFLEVNSLEASSGMIGWARHKNYLAYGVISNAFNPFNFNKTKKNIFGQASECGLLLIHADNLDISLDRIERLNLAEIKTVDDIALLLLHKFQYANEVLSQTSVASKLGIGYSSPEQRKMWCYKLQKRFH